MKLEETATSPRRRRRHRSHRRRRTYAVLAVAIIFLGVIVYLVLRSEFQTRARFTMTPDRQQSEPASSSLLAEAAIERLRAITYWKADSLRFTADVRRALMREDGRPVFFMGRIRDIEENADAYTVTFDVNTLSVGPTIRFALRCSRELVDAERKKGTGESFAVIAAVSDVRLTHDDPGAISTGLERQYLASGECLFLEGGQ